MARHFGRYHVQRCIGHPRKLGFFNCGRWTLEAFEVGLFVQGGIGVGTWAFVYGPEVVKARVLAFEGLFVEWLRSL